LGCFVAPGGLMRGGWLHAVCQRKSNRPCGPTGRRHYGQADHRFCSPPQRYYYSRSLESAMVLSLVCSRGSFQALGGTGHKRRACPAGPAGARDKPESPAAPSSLLSAWRISKCAAIGNINCTAEQGDEMQRPLCLSTMAPIFLVAADDGALCGRFSTKTFGKDMPRIPSPPPPLSPGFSNKKSTEVVQTHLCTRPKHAREKAGTHGCDRRLRLRPWAPRFRGATRKRNGRASSCPSFR